MVAIEPGMLKPEDGAEPRGTLPEDITNLKRSQLEAVARHREILKQSPRLRWLFFEITERCNLRCRHCGSSCTAEGRALTKEDVSRTLSSVAKACGESAGGESAGGEKACGESAGGESAGGEKACGESAGGEKACSESARGNNVHGPRVGKRGSWPTVCLTGGEPMLHPDFFEIAALVKQMGFDWGMTTNATLIDDAAAQRLKQAGMSTVSVSLDGLERSHDSLRQVDGAWRMAIRGLKALQKAGFKPQVTTVFHQGNFDEMGALYKLLGDMGITSWRPINVEPIGRACESDGMMLTAEQFRQLISFIRGKRFDPTNTMEVTFGCSHYLGTADERMVRDHYFLCGAGILTASVRSNGDIGSCLDIENRQDLVQGNIHRDDFMEVWQNGFGALRRDRTADCRRCIECPERFVCGGDSAHTWDYDRNEPLLCYRDFGS